MDQSELLNQLWVLHTKYQKMADSERSGGVKKLYKEVAGEFFKAYQDTSTVLLDDSTT